jgi:hypothetical protein
VKPSGLIALLGKPSASEDDEEPAEGASTGSVEKEFAREAFAALQEDDEEGFVSALLSAVRSCARKSRKSADSMMSEEEDDESY